MQTNKQKFGGEQLHTGLRNSYFIRRPLCSVHHICVYSVFVWVAIYPSNPPTFYTAVRKTLQTKLFSGKRFILFAHSLTLSFLSLPLPRTIAIHSFVHSIRLFVGWLVLVGQPKDPFHTYIYIDRPFYVCICYGRLSLLFHYVFVVHVQWILGKSTHKKGMPKYRIVGKKDSSGSSRNPLSYRMLHSFGMVRSHVCVSVFGFAICM